MAGFSERLFESSREERGSLKNSPMIAAIAANKKIMWGDDFFMRDCHIYETFKDLITECEEILVSDDTKKEAFGKLITSLEKFEGSLRYEIRPGMSMVESHHGLTDWKAYWPPSELTTQYMDFLRGVTRPWKVLPWEGEDPSQQPKRNRLSLAWLIAATLPHIHLNKQLGIELPPLQNEDYQRIFSYYTTTHFKSIQTEAEKVLDLLVGDMSNEIIDSVETQYRKGLQHDLDYFNGIELEEDTPWLKAKYS